jgi:hypothetical protein
MKTNKTTTKDLNTKAINGIQKYLSGEQALKLLGQSMAPTALIVVLEADNAAYSQADAAKAAWKDLLEKQKDQHTNARKLRRALRNHLLAIYTDKDVAVFDDFGMKPPKPTVQKSAKTKSIAAEKAKATRAARHIMGRRQRARIKAPETPQANGNAEPQTPPSPPQAPNDAKPPHVQ